MVICATCGVELEENMERCPLCGAPAGGAAHHGHVESRAAATKPGRKDIAARTKGSPLLQRILWQITFTVLFSCLLATLIIDLAAHGHITWSAYPVTICLIFISYASLMAFWHTRKIWQVTGGLLLSAALLVTMDMLFPRLKWLLQLGLPILCAANLTGLLLAGLVRLAPHRGLNLIAYTFTAVAILCASIEGILSVYKENTLVLRWSVIVAACLLPVIAALLFMHYRIKKDPEMDRIFHT